MKTLVKRGMLQGLIVGIYCLFIGYILQNGNKVFGVADSFVGPALFLTIFVFSALFCLLVVFYEPYRLFVSGKKEQALSVVVYTVISLLVVLAAMAGYMISSNFLSFL